MVNSKEIYNIKYLIFICSHKMFVNGFGFEHFLTFKENAVGILFKLNARLKTPKNQLNSKQRQIFWIFYYFYSFIYNFIEFIGIYVN